jgi:hypothetical protein
VRGEAVSTRSESVRDIHPQTVQPGHTFLVGQIRSTSAGPFLRFRKERSRRTALSDRLHGLTPDIAYLLIRLNPVVPAHEIPGLVERPHC